MYGYWWGMSFLWWIFWAVVLVSFFVFLAPGSRRTISTRSSDPLDVLKRRYAAGEITTAEYDERRARILDTSTEPRRTAATSEPVRTTSAVPPVSTHVEPEQRTRH